MKKFCAVFALFCVMFLFAACSGGSKESVYGDTDTSDSTSDKTDSDASNTNSDDADSQSDSTADTTPDNGDSADDADSDKPDSDNPDTTPDGGDTAPDNGDTEPDDDADTSHENEPEVGDTREAGCTGLPTNASWNTVSSITQTWNGNEWTPSTEATFSTTPSSTKCRFVCNQNYEWNDSECVAGTRTANCEGLPEHAVWNGAASITQTWDDENWVPSNTGSYNKTPNSSECRFQCAVNYNWNGSQCVAATIQTDCMGLPENALWNTVSNITQSWSGTAWTPSEVGTFNETPSYSECRFVCKTNYSWNGIACAPNELPAVACTGKPENAVWNSVSNITQTWNGNEWVPTTSATFSETPSTTECRFKCAENYEWNDTQCAAKTREANCTGLPTNAVWNTASSITQTWDGNAWTPSNAGTYNETPSSNECYFKCNQHYTWNSSTSKCVADTQPANCLGLPTNAVWNTASSITQTWNGNGWIPSNAGTYNETPSSNECHYKCGSGYHTEDGGISCISNTKTNVACTGLPTNAEWNTASSINQTWNGNNWTPAATGSFSSNPSATECKFKCKEHYTWNPSTLECAADTKSETCTGLPDNAQWNTVSSITQTWNGNTWTPSTTGSYNRTASDSECRFVCKENYDWDNSMKRCVTEGDTRVVNCSNLPAHASYNTVSSITQTYTYIQWWGSGFYTWTPSTTSKYDETPSTTECHYKCDSGYQYDGTSMCVVVGDTRIRNCTGLPTNAEWNTVANITQTWNGTEWTPTISGTYDTTASTTQCRYKCKSGYTWDGSSNCFAVGDTRTANCTGLPANTQWNTASSITQTWNGNSWTPSTTGTYNETASIEECRYKCASGYTRENGTCINKKTVNCTGLPENMEWNTASTITQTWNGNAWTPSNISTYNETASTEECRYKCELGKWNGSQCVLLTLSEICTGQEVCYNNSSSITCPTSSSESFFGQDAYYAAQGKCTPKKFSVKTISGDNIVLDHNTGLMWQQTIPTGTYTWDEAVSYCNGLNYAGYSDWRLPQIKELLTTVDYSRHPFIDTTYFSNIQNETILWSASKYYNSSSYYGTVGYYYYALRYRIRHDSYNNNDSVGVPTSALGSNNWNVMCVR